MVEAPHDLRHYNRELGRLRDRETREPRWTWDADAERPLLRKNVEAAVSARRAEQERARTIKQARAARAAWLDLKAMRQEDPEAVTEAEVAAARVEALRLRGLLKGRAR